MSGFAAGTKTGRAGVDALCQTLLRAIVCVLWDIKTRHYSFQDVPHGNCGVSVNIPLLLLDSCTGKGRRLGEGV